MIFLIFFFYLSFKYCVNEIDLNYFIGIPSIITAHQFLPCIDIIKLTHTFDNLSVELKF